MPKEASMGDFGLANSPPRRFGCRFPLLCCLGLFAIWPATCGINTFRRTSEEKQLYEEARKLGGSSRIYEGDVEVTVIEISGNIDLDLSGTNTNDADLTSLMKLPAFARVTSLSLAGAPITDKGVASLEGAPRLHSLDLSRTAVTDECLVSILKVPVGRLNLSGTGLTDAGVELLKKPPGGFLFHYVDMTDTKVSEQKVRELGKTKPQGSYLYLYGQKAASKSVP
jgi:hypothetical protein